MEINRIYFSIFVGAADYLTTGDITKRMTNDGVITASRTPSNGTIVADYCQKQNVSQQWEKCYTNIYMEVS